MLLAFVYWLVATHPFRNVGGGGVNGIEKATWKDMLRRRN